MKQILQDILNCRVYRKALQEISSGKLPETGEYYRNGQPMKYRELYGPTTELQHLRDIAFNALNKSTSKP